MFENYILVVIVLVEYMQQNIYSLRNENRFQFKFTTFKIFYMMYVFLIFHWVHCML